MSEPLPSSRRVTFSDELLMVTLSREFEPCEVAINPENFDIVCKYTSRVFHSIALDKAEKIARKFKRELTFIVSPGNGEVRVTLVFSRAKEEDMKKMIVRLDFHTARKTDARTWWTVVSQAGEKLELEEAMGRGLIRCVWKTLDPGEKTHWYEYYEVLVPGLKFIRHRISNRGNYHRAIYTVEELLASEGEIPPQFFTHEEEGE